MYGITPEDYRRLYEAQGGRCAMCQRATGKTKRLAVDHEHYKEGCQHAPDVGCRRCVRSLLCSPCNITIGRLGPEALARGIMIMKDPPAQHILNGTMTP